MVFCELWVGESKGLVFRIFVKSWAKALISGWLEECEAEEAAAAAATAAEIIIFCLVILKFDLKNTF